MRVLLDDALTFAAPLSGNRGELIILPRLSVGMRRARWAGQTVKSSVGDADPCLG